ncbi:MAG: 4Fe-4S double cluster binding domain-containing protein [Sedimentisphaerales bacterium]|nr:4Fe-4S double cluster binding domain-containing protein [Sedimentisphaerales bacterium]
MRNLSTKLRESLLEKGACLVGYADVSDLSYEATASLKKAVSIAVALNPSIISEISKGPTINYYQEYIRANNLLSDLCGRAVDILITEGHKAVAQKPTVKQVDLTKTDAHLPHKTVATKAGFGWIGKSALLITKKYGAAIRLASVLTDAGLDTAEPIKQSMCGECRECVDHCPAKAIKGNNWQPGCSRDSIFDAFACCETARKLSKKIEVRSTICGICINVCPWTQKYISQGQKS